MEKLSEVFERCQQRFPTVQLPLDVFRSRVETILSEEMRSAGKDAKLHYEDLFLASACAGGDRVAWEHFADDYIPLLKSFAAQACGNPGDGEELAHEIAAKLMKDKERLGGYNGRGSLAGWLRVTVSHAAIDRFRRMNRLTSLDALEEREAEALCQDSGRQPDEENLDSRWGPIVTGITEEQLRSLSAQDRLLLSLYYLRGVTLHEIGRQLQVHEATASRWLDRLRNEIRKNIERTLKKKYRLRPSEIQSLWKWISPAALTESLGENIPGGADSPGDQSAQANKKTAMKENSGVIKEEEVR